MSYPSMPCQAQDVLSFLSTAAERLDMIDNHKEVAETLTAFANECTGKEARVLKKFAKAINEVYGRVK